MKTQFGTLLLGITIGASVATIIAGAERRRLQAALASASRSAVGTIISPDNDKRGSQGRRLLQQSRWEREALGLPLDDDDSDDDDE